MSEVMLIQKCINCVEWHKITVRTLDTLTSSSAKGSIMEFWAKCLDLGRGEDGPPFSVVCNLLYDGNLFSSLILLDCIDTPIDQCASVKLVAGRHFNMVMMSITSRLEELMQTTMSIFRSVDFSGCFWCCQYF